MSAGKLLIGLIVVLAAVLVVYFGAFRGGPSDDEVAGTIQPVKQHRVEQIGDGAAASPSRTTSSSPICSTRCCFTG